VLLLVSSLAHAQECEYGDDDCDHEVWANGEIWEMMEFLDCENLHVNVPGRLQVHNESTWSLFHDIYQQVVGEEDSSIPSYDGGIIKSGFQVPITVLFTDDAGRGVFANDLIPQNTLVWKATNTARFRSAAQYRQFLKRLPPYLACDVLEWAYTRKSRSTRSIVICVDLDEGSFSNGGMSEFDTNFGFASDAVKSNGCNLEFYTNREVWTGEELRVDYTTFNSHNGWWYLGLQ
jgi:hypothetical protein